MHFLTKKGDFEFDLSHRTLEVNLSRETEDTSCPICGWCLQNVNLFSTKCHLNSSLQNYIGQEVRFLITLDYTNLHLSIELLH